mgnify:FL=1
MEFLLDVCVSLGTKSGREALFVDGRLCNTLDLRLLEDLLLSRPSGLSGGRPEEEVGWCQL